MAKSSTSFEPNNDSATTHGLEANVKRLQHGQPLTGPAAEAEAMVRAELETVGIGEIVKAGAIRLEGMCRGFYHLASEALAGGDLDKADRFVKRYGWLQLGALRAWAQYESMQKAADDGQDYERILEGQKNGH